MVVASITSLGFEQSSTGLGGLGGLIKGPLSVVAGSVDWKTTRVHMNMDVRVVDINKAKIVITNYHALQLTARDNVEAATGLRKQLQQGQ